MHFNLQMHFGVFLATFEKWINLKYWTGQNLAAGAPCKTNLKSIVWNNKGREQERY